MKKQNHNSVNMEWDEYTADDITRMRPKVVADMMTRLSRQRAEGVFAVSVLERLIQTETGYDSIDLAEKIDERDLISESLK